MKFCTSRRTEMELKKKRVERMAPLHSPYSSATANERLRTLTPHIITSYYSTQGAVIVHYTRKRVLILMTSGAMPCGEWNRRIYPVKVLAVTSGRLRRRQKDSSRGERVVRGAHDSEQSRRGHPISGYYPPRGFSSLHLLL